MARRSDKQEDILEKEAARIGYEFMLNELQQLIEIGVTGTQRIAISDQQAKIRDRLEALKGAERDAASETENEAV